MDHIQLSYGKAPHRIEAVIVVCGKDLVVIFGGGQAYHTGAVATAVSHPGLKDPHKITSTASVFTVAGHKEDVIVRTAALKISKKLQRTVTVIAGLHIDAATTQDIDQLLYNFEALTEEIIKTLE